MSEKMTTTEFTTLLHQFQKLDASEQMAVSYFVKGMQAGKETTLLNIQKPDPKPAA